MAEDKDGKVSHVGYEMACAMAANSEVYCIQLPTPEEIRHSRKVARVLDQITDGRFLQMSFADGAKQKRLRAVAKQIVRREESQKALSRSSAN
jgi:hypothetical protein